MAVGVELTSAGVRVAWGTETTSGVKPTDWKAIRGIKSTPDLNPETSSLECTDLGDTEYKRYVGGLKDTGGSLAFTANNTNAFQEDWAGIIAAYDTASKTDLHIWFAIYIPGMNKSFFMSVEPQPLGLSAISVDTVLEIDAYVAPQKIHGWDTAITKPMYDGENS